MNKNDILNQLTRYRRKRGWGRWFFGATQGFEELKQFYRHLDNGELSMEKLQELLGLLCKRRARLSGRDDDYDKPKGKRKLTNSIYLALEQQLVNAYRAKLRLQGEAPVSIDQHLPKNTPIRELALLHNEKNDCWYAFQMKPYLRRLTMKGFVNPYTQDLLTKPEVEKWSTNDWFQGLINAASKHLTQLKKLLVDGDDTTVPIKELVINKDKTEVINIRTDLSACTVSQFKAKRGFLESTLERLTWLSDPMFEPAFSLMDKTYQHLKDDSTYSDTPLVFLFLSADQQRCFDVRELLQSPDEYKDLSPRMRKEIAAFVNDNPCISDAEKTKYLSAIKMERTTLLGKEEIPQDHLFTSESGIKLDATLLLQTFTVESGFINPYTGAALSEDDHKQLREHPLVGESFQRLERILGQYPSDVAAPYPKTSMLLHLFVSAAGEVIDIYQQENLIQRITDLYLANQLTRDEFREVLNLAYNQTAADIALKQALTTAEEDNLTDDPIFENLQRAVRFQSELTLEDLPKATFWALMHRELLLVLKVNPLPRQRMPSMNGAASTTLAIETFDNVPEDYLGISGRNGYFNYPLQGGNDQFGERQYVVRREELYGDNNGRAALKNIVGTFKGSLLTALRHDLCKEMLNQIDTSGICVAERVRQLNAWRIGLDKPSSPSGTTKTVLDKLNDYQAELMASYQVRMGYYVGDRAVEFIMQRHRGEKFIYTDEHGDEKEGVITRDIVAYFLHTWMDDDLVTGAPKELPACLEPRKRAAKYS